MPRWVYAPEYDKFVVVPFSGGAHEEIADDVYRIYNDDYQDHDGWNRFWGGSIWNDRLFGGADEYKWSVDYAPMDYVKKIGWDSLKSHLPPELKAKVLSAINEYRSNCEAGYNMDTDDKQTYSKTAATIGPLKVIQDPVQVRGGYALRDIQAEPDVYDPQFRLENDETARAMTFAYIEGQLILAETHHQGIMAAMMAKGWEWEDFFTAPQLWGWISYTRMKEEDRSPEDERLFVRPQFTSDSGHQNEELIPECLMVFADKFKLPAVTFKMITGIGVVETDNRDYGGGLTHNPSRIEDPNKQEIGLERVHTEIKPPVRTGHFAAFEKNAGRTWRWHWTPKYGLDIWEGNPSHNARASYMWGDDFYDPYAAGYIFEGNPGDVTVTPYTDREQTVPPEVLEQLEAYRQKILEEDERLASVEYVSGDITLQIFEKNGKMRWSLNDKADGYFDPEKFRTTIVHNDYGSPGKVTEIVVEAFSILPKQALNK
jgi:hypothetical protein